MGGRGNSLTQNYIRFGKFSENGISAFKVDENGMPVVENLQQMQSLYDRIGENAYELKGSSSRKGADNEPLVSVTSSQLKKIEKSDIEKIIENTLKQKYRSVENTTTSYNDFKKDAVFFKGKKYTNPLKSWNTDIGATAHNSKDSGLRLVGGYKEKTIKVKDQAKDVSHFTSKSGKSMVRYTYEGKSYTDTKEKFESRTDLVFEKEPLRIVKKKK